MTSAHHTQNLSGHAGDKAALRRRYLVRRDEAAQSAGPGAAVRAKDNFLAGIELPPRAVVSAYWPMRNEMDPRPLVDALSARGHACALPVMTMRDAPLDFRAWQAGDELEAGPFGTQQPKSSAVALVPDILIVPLVAFDGQGRRLGYGGGYYDRTLAGLRKGSDVLAVGYAYAGQQVQALPQDPFDQGLDWLVTENSVRAFE